MIYGATYVTPSGFRWPWVFFDDTCSCKWGETFNRAISAVNAIQVFCRVLDSRSPRGHRPRWRVVRSPVSVRRHVREAWTWRFRTLEWDGR